MDLQWDRSCKRGGANWSLSCCPIHLHFLPITENYLCSRLDMGVNPFWLSCWCSLQISTGGAGERVRVKNKLGKLLIIVHRKKSIGNDITGGKEKNSGRWGINYWCYNSSSCLQTLQHHWFSCFHSACHYWLVKTIFSSQRWIQMCSQSTGGVSNLVIITQNLFNRGRISLFFDASKGNEPSLKQSESLLLYT